MDAVTEKQINITNKLAFSLKELSDLTSLSQNFFRSEIRERRLIAKRFGARVLVLASDWQSYAESQPNYKSNEAGAMN